MKITPLEIKKEKDAFKKRVRGYDTQEVDFFLDKIADDYEAVLTENKKYSDKIIELETGLKKYAEVEKTLQDTLVTAQVSTQRSMENSQRESELIIREAKLRANEIIRKAQETESKIKNEIQTLNTQKKILIKKIRNLLGSQLDFIKVLEEEEEDLQSSHSTENAVLPEEFNEIEEKKAEPVVSKVVEEKKAEPVVSKVVEEKKAEPVVSKVVEEKKVEPVFEEIIEKKNVEKTISELEKSEEDEKKREIKEVLENVFDQMGELPESLLNELEKIPETVLNEAEEEANEINETEENKEEPQEEVKKLKIEKPAEVPDLMKILDETLKKVKMIEKEKNKS